MSKRASTNFTNIIAILGILIGVGGVIAPMVWDSFKEKKNITLELISNVELFTNEKKIEGLKVLYNNQEIQNLRKLTYRFTNTGKTEILATNVRIPLTLNLNEAVFLNYRLDNVKPQYLINDVKSHHVVPVYP